MPHQRAEGQVNVSLWIDQSFIDAIDGARKKQKFKMSRSAFIRWALSDYLKDAGFPVADNARFAPDRAGKGGPKRNTYPSPKFDGSTVMTDVSLNEGARGERILKNAAKDAKHGSP